MKYDVSVTRVTYYEVKTERGSEAAVDLVLGSLTRQRGESVKELGEETLRHSVDPEDEGTEHADRS